MNWKKRYRRLEERVLLDAAGAATVADADSTADDVLDSAREQVRQEQEDLTSLIAALGQAQDEVDSGAAETDFGEEIVFVDEGVDDRDVLLGALSGDFDVHVIPSGVDGAQFIKDTLAASGKTYDAVHILSHGDSGWMALGNQEVNLESLRGGVGETIASWGDHLSGSADILLYGCEVAEGEQGRDFVDLLADLTDADVAASIDLTGAEELGGDWELEYGAGVEGLTNLSQTLDLAVYQSTFAAPDNTAPVLDSAVVRGDGTQIVLTYTEANGLDAANTPSITDFDISVNGGTSFNPASVAPDAANNTVTLTLGSGDEVSVTDTVSLDYDGNPIQDPSGNLASSLAGESVINAAIYWSSDTWTAIGAAGAGAFDYSDDQQTGQPAADIVGAEGNPGFQVHFDDNGAASSTDGTLSFRIRLGESGTNYYFAGFDADLDGDIDAFLVVDPTGNLAIWGNDPTKANISPATTGIDSTFEPYSATGTILNYSAESVSSVDPTFDPDLDGVGDDYYVSFSIPFAEVVNALATNPAGAISIDDQSPLRYVLASATQSNTFNQDIAGLPKDYDADQTYASSGAFSDPVDLSGNVVTPTGAPVLNDLQDDAVDFVAGSAG